MPTHLFFSYKRCIDSGIMCGWACDFGNFYSEKWLEQLGGSSKSIMGVKGASSPASAEGWWQQPTVIRKTVSFVITHIRSHSRVYTNIWGTCELGEWEHCSSGLGWGGLSPIRLCCFYSSLLQNQSLHIIPEADLLFSYFFLFSLMKKTHSFRSRFVIWKTQKFRVKSHEVNL